MNAIVTCMVNCCYCGVVIKIFTHDTVWKTFFCCSHCLQCIRHPNKIFTYHIYHYHVYILFYILSYLHIVFTYYHIYILHILLQDFGSYQRLRISSSWSSTATHIGGHGTMIQMMWPIRSTTSLLALIWRSSKSAGIIAVDHRLLVALLQIHFSARYPTRDRMRKEECPYRSANPISNSFFITLNTFTDLAEPSNAKYSMQFGRPLTTV